MIALGRAVRIKVRLHEPVVISLISTVYRLICITVLGSVMVLLAVTHIVALFFGGRYRAHVSVAKDCRCLSQSRASPGKRQSHVSQSIDKVPVDTKRFSGDLADGGHFCLHHRVLILETAMTAIDVPA